MKFHGSLDCADVHDGLSHDAWLDHPEARCTDLHPKQGHRQWRAAVERIARKEDLAVSWSVYSVARGSIIVSASTSSLVGNSAGWGRLDHASHSHACVYNDRAFLEDLNWVRIHLINLRANLE